MRTLKDKILKPPTNDAGTDFPFVGSDQGGLGLVPMKDEYAIQSIAQAHQLLNSDDHNIRYFAKCHLLRVTRDRFHNGLEFSESLRWISAASTEIKHAQNTTWWKKIRDSVLHLRRKQITCKFELDVDDNVVLMVHRPGQDLEILPTKADDCCKELHKLIHTYYFEKWRKPTNPDPNSHEDKSSTITPRTKPKAQFRKVQGKCADMLALHSYSNLVMSSIILSPDTWRFAYVARNNLLPLNHRIFRDKLCLTRHCRLCHDYKESEPHVLNLCKHHELLITARHDKVLNILTEAILAKGLNVAREKKHSWRNVTYIPDLVIQKNGQLFIIDVKSSFDSLRTVQSVAKDNVTKYTPLKTMYRSQLGLNDRSIHVSTFVVCSLGSWLPQNNSILKQLGFLSTEIKPLAERMSAAVIKASYFIFNTHNKTRSEPLDSVNIPDKIDPSTKNSDSLTSKASNILPNTPE